MELTNSAQQTTPLLAIARLQTTMHYARARSRDGDGGVSTTSFRPPAKEFQEVVETRSY